MKNCRIEPGPARMTIGLGLALAALACLVAAAIADMRTFEIPNGLSIALLATAVGYGLVTPGFGWLSHGAAVMVMFGLGLLLFSRGWMGGGDIKLLVALAGWTGLPGLPMQLAFVGIAGGGLALVLIIARRGLPAAGLASATLPRMFQGDAPLPYAVAILAGAAWWGRMNWPL
jgi:prepilin peptidase CpaA